MIKIPHTLIIPSENGIFQARFTADDNMKSQIQSYMTMYGFSNIQFSNAAFAQDSAAVVATKAAFKAGGTSLRNRKKNASAA